MATDSNPMKPIDQVIAASEKHYWDDVVVDLEQGKLPLRDSVIHGLRSGNPPPKIVCEFIADILSSKDAFSDKKEASPFTTVKYAIYYVGYCRLSRAVSRWERIKGRKMKNRKEATLERAADRLGISVTTLKKAIKKTEEFKAAMS